jgi:hypothetical protein
MSSARVGQKAEAKAYAQLEQNMMSHDLVLGYQAMPSDSQ